jgi:hypothetical protein
VELVEVAQLVDILRSIVAGCPGDSIGEQGESGPC